MKVFHLWQVLCFFASSVAAAQSLPRPQDVLTVDEVVSLAVKNDPALLSSEQDIIIAKQRVSEARFMNLPQFALSGTLSKVNLEYPLLLGTELGDRYLDPAISNNFYTLRVYALQPLYTGGRNKNTIRLAKTAHNQAKVNYETVRTDAVYKAKKAFYTLLLTQKLRELTLSYKTRAGILSSAGTQKDWEALETELILTRLDSELERAVHAESAARNELVSVLNREPSYTFEIAGELKVPAVQVPEQKSLVTAMEMRSELKSEIYKAQMDDIAVNMAMIRRYPNVYLGASYDVNGYNVDSLTESSIRSNNWAASIAIHFPLSYDIWTQVVQRRAQQRQGDLKRVELQDKIRFEIISAHKELEFWTGESLKRQEILSRLEKKYEAIAAQSSNSFSALRMLRSMLELKKSCLEALYQAILARIKLEWARGADL